MSRKSGLRVRQHQRRGIELPVEFVVCEEHRSQVKFSTSSSALDEHTIRGVSLDISPGGLGFSSGQFLPRSCEGTLRVFDPAPVRSRADGSPVHEIAFAQRVKVRRVRMIGPEPTYFIGVSFADPEGIDPEIANRMLLLQSQMETGQPSESPGEPDE